MRDKVLRSHHTVNPLHLHTVAGSRSTTSEPAQSGVLISPVISQVAPNTET